MFNRTKIILGSVGGALVNMMTAGGKSAVIASQLPSLRSPRVLTSAYARARYIRNRSCYQPHQGRQEIQRRREQIAHGMIQATA